MNGVLCDNRSIYVGVPQSCIVGPMMLIIYISDKSRAFGELTPILYAEDTTLTFEYKIFETLTDVATTELYKLHDWAVSNCLTINYNKIVYMSFGHRCVSEATPDAVFAGNKIRTETSIKLLGVHLDSKLNSNDHIEHVS